MNNSTRTFKGTVHSASDPAQSFPYYEEMLTITWVTVKRPATYEYNIIHQLNCPCCARRVPEDSNNKAKLNRRKERRYY